MGNRRKIIKSNNIKLILKGMIDKDIVSYAQLATKMNYTLSTVRRWLAGKQGINPETLQRIEDLLEIKLIREEMKKDLKGWYYL